MHADPTGPRAALPRDRSARRLPGVRLKVLRLTKEGMRPALKLLLELSSQRSQLPLLLWHVCNVMRADGGCAPSSAGVRLVLPQGECEMSLGSPWAWWEGCPQGVQPLLMKHSAGPREWSPSLCSVVVLWEVPGFGGCKPCGRRSMALGAVLARPMIFLNVAWLRPQKGHGAGVAVLFYTVCGGARSPSLSWFGGDKKATLLVAEPCKPVRVPRLSSQMRETLRVSCN